MYSRSNAGHGLDECNSSADISQTKRVSSHSLKNLLLLLLLTLFLLFTVAEASANHHIDSVKYGFPFYRQSISDLGETFNTVNYVKCKKHVIDCSEKESHNRYVNVGFTNKMEPTAETGSSTFNSTRRSKRSSFSTSDTLSSETGSFVLPESSGKIAELENKMKQIKEDINQLKNDSSVSGLEKLYMSGLERTLTDMKKYIDDKNRDTQQSLSTLDELVENQISTVNGFKIELDKMKLEAKEKERVAKQRLLPAECASAIINDDFETAEKKLNEIEDNNQINLIVRNVFDNQVGNFDKLLQFADRVASIRKSFSVYKSLNSQMGGQMSFYKAIDLLKSLVKKGLLDLPSTDELRKGVDSLAATVSYVIKESLKQRMKSEFTNYYYRNHTWPTDMSDKVLLLDKRLFYDTITEAITESYNPNKIEDFLLFIRSFNYTNQAMAGCVALFEQMKKNGNLYSSEIVRLASHIKAYKEKEDIDPVFIDQVERMRMEWPSSVRVLMYSSTICIRNTAHNEYLYGAGVPGSNDNFLLYDSQRRNVFTYVPGGQVNQGDWAIKYLVQDDCFLIKNIKHDEYLYADHPSLNYDGSRRRVFTWITKKDKPKYQFCWTISAAEENVYLKHTLFSEYLYADGDYKYDKDRRHVFTFMFGQRAPGIVRSSRIWSLEDC